MVSSTCLDMQYNLSKIKFLRKPSRMLSRQNSGSLPVSEQDTDVMKLIFDKFDRDKDGKISPDDYKDILSAVQNKESMRKEVQKIFKVADLDRDGFIDFKEFVAVQEYREGELKLIDIQNAFRIIDSDGNGKITAEEVFELLSRLGGRYSIQDCRRMVRAVDTNVDGEIGMDEFMTMMTGPMNV